MHQNMNKFLLLGLLAVLVAAGIVLASPRQRPVFLPVDTQDRPWKTYSNSKYNFSVDYPADWVIRDREEKIKIPSAKNPGSGDITFDYFGASFTSKTGASFLVMPRGFHPGVYDALSAGEPVQTTVMVSGEEAIEYRWPDSSAVHMRFEFKSFPNSWGNSNKVLISAPKSETETINRMIESFQFTK